MFSALLLSLAPMLKETFETLAIACPFVTLEIACPMKSKSFNLVKGEMRKKVLKSVQ